ncbi:gamma-glutamyl-gamma-aminobutyrate hydrolase family protein [Corynebacterium sp. TA-R-1]|uniref:Gamma-glutamyl-gamma-aminobutyrate hydrolase family protein n=1 Tax=Corynebacterium stercoris TaxID=2943490 RepID=A0ABT1FZQ5_9CORY|nr:gamma-glutamyl-gamma-aminobutyrate hydrolase family protein [Corynebacterium stercoris]MCP1387082.1 gamma-glutamyl-gamma-aminobutyrate hydrolase family protein [Corynebacterium stercoris]
MAQLLFLSLRNGEIGPQVARAEYHDALQSAGLDEVDMELRVIDAPGVALGPLDGVAGVIVGGSSLNVTNSEPELYDDYQKHVHAVLAELIESGVPVFFVCFGLSWLVHQFGGNVGHDHAEDSGPTTVSVTDAGREDVLLAGAPAEFTALTGHTENPQEVPEELTLLATGPDGLVQIVRYGDHVWATQFHAEMDADAMRTRMDFYYDYGYFAPEDYARIVADLPNHDVAAANGLVRRFAEYCAAR